MKKLVRNFVLLFVLSFIYVLFNKAINLSVVEGVIISVGTAAIFSLLIEMITNLNEENLRLKILLTDEEVEIIRQIRLVIRDGILTFLLCYGTMTVSLGGAGLSLSAAIPFVIAAIAPTLVVCALSKELRLPSRKGTVTESEMGLEELA